MCRSIYAWLIRFVSIVQVLNNISKDFNSSKIALWQCGQYIFQRKPFTSIFLPNMLSLVGATLFEYTSIWVNVVFFVSQQWCWVQHFDHTSSMSSQSKALGASWWPIWNGPAFKQRVILANQAFLFKIIMIIMTSIVKPTKEPFWILTCIQG